MSSRRLIAYAVGGVLVALVFMLLTLQLASDPNVKANLGDNQFRVGRVDVLAREIAKNGPLVFQDLGGKYTNVALVHVGSDPAKGWFAVRMWSTLPNPFPLQLTESRREFEDYGHGKRYALDSPYLRRYPTRVVDGQVVVDLRAGATSSAPSTTASSNSTRN